MAEELRYHLELRAERNRAAGLPPDEARAAARRSFGGVEQIKERSRDALRFGWVEEFVQDLRYAARALRKDLGFSLTAIFTLAIGLGVNFALFTLYNAVALRSLPVRAPEELVNVRGRSEASAQQNESLFSWTEYLDYRDHNKMFSELAAQRPGLLGADFGETRPAGAAAIADGPRPNVVLLKAVTGNYFSVLGAGFALGRPFRPEETQAAREAPVIVLSHRFWQGTLHGDPNILGQSIRLNGRSHTVVGVTSPEFLGDHPVPPAGWLPVDEMRTERTLALVGRMQASASLAQVKSDLELIARRRAQAEPHEGAKTSVELAPGLKWFDLPLTPETLAALAPVLLGFGLVLMIACTNVTNLLLARGVTRHQEIGVRLTLGANRGRVIRQLLTENFLLCGLGSVAGLALAMWTMQLARPLVLSFLPPDWAPLTEMWQVLWLGVDARVVACAAVLTLVATVAAGLAPALHATRTNLVSALKDEGSVFGRRLASSRLRNLLVVAQVAVCLMLLSCAGLLGRNFWRARSASLGFEARETLSVSFKPTALPTNPAARAVWMREATATLDALPGVAGATLAHGGPFLGALRGTVRPMVGSSAGAERPLAYGLVAGNFFRTFGIPLQQGRAFTAADEAQGTSVAIVSETAARRFWPGENPLGKTLAIDRAEQTSRQPGTSPASAGQHGDYVVVGVVRDVRDGFWNPDRSFVYLPLAPDLAGGYELFLRPRDAAAGTVAAVAQAASRAGLPVELHRRLGVRLEEEILPFLALGALSAALGGLALLLAMIGLYGVMAFSVRQRTREIGIRIALGASAQRVVGLFLGEGMKLVALGLLVGSGASAALLLLLSRIWVALGSQFDVVALAGATLLLAAIAWLACWLSARPATRVEPIVALRCE